ncbi:MAG: multiple monosaccharide ABC transporter permease [Pseudomonadota bacterium]
MGKQIDAGVAGELASAATTAALKNAGAERKTALGFIKNNLRDYGMLFSLVAIMAFFQYTTDGTLMQPLNITNLLLQNSYVVIMALGMLMVIVAGHIDLSVGSVVGFIGALAAVLIVNYDFNYVAASLICLVMGGVIGAAQGYFVAYVRIPSFIVTLAGMLVFKGLTLALLQGQSVGPFPEGFQRLSSGFIPDAFGMSDLRLTSLLLGVAAACALIYVKLRARARQSGSGMSDEPLAFFLVRNALLAGVVVYFSYLLASYKGMPNVLIVMALLIVAYTFIANRTVIGRRVYAVGGNEKASRLSGIKTERVTFATFVNMGVLAALAGLIFAARLNTATPKAGNGFELDVIAACFIGGASASGGVGKVMGAVIGAFVMGVMNNGMSIMGIGIDYQQVIKGLVLLAAVFVDVYNKNK